jgi:5,10-methylenetetrahydrofolate reductase
MKDKLQSGDFVVLAEMEPPKGVDVSGLLKNALRVKGIVDAFIVPEMGSAVMRMSSLGGAMLLQAQGLPTVMQVCCRDRNRLALQADLLSAYACGISNLMVVVGDDPRFGDHPQTKLVHDIDIYQLLQLIQKLQQGRDMSGVELQGNPKFLVGSTVNPGVDGTLLDQERRDMEDKIKTGVQFLITPPIFDSGVIEPLLQSSPEYKSHIIPTVMLLKSVGMAKYIDRNLKHIHIPSSLIQRLQKAPDKESECIKIASERIRACRNEGFGGVFITTMGWEDKLSQIIEGM